MSRDQHTWSDRTTTLIQNVYSMALSTLTVECKQLLHFNCYPIIPQYPWKKQQQPKRLNRQMCQKYTINTEFPLEWFVKSGVANTHSKYFKSWYTINSSWCTVWELQLKLGWPTTIYNGQNPSSVVVSLSLLAMLGGVWCLVWVMSKVDFSGVYS